MKTQKKQNMDVLPPCPTKGADGMRDQEIEIYYRFIGKID